jgi:excisionase family DNA binding protein
MKQEFKTSDVARIFDLTHMTVINWIKSGRLPAYETGGGHYRIMRHDLIDFIKDTGKPLPKELESDKYRILIVDDEKNVVESIKLMLDDLGVELVIETAYNGFEAGMKVTQFLPHLVTLDAIMPGFDGDIVVKLIKDNKTLKDTKILVFTGYPGEGNKLLKLGADRAIDKASKEAEPEPFRKEVCRLLGVKHTKVMVNV